MNIKVTFHPERVDLLVRRELPAVAWPSGELMEWERFSFPRRCTEQVVNLAVECLAAGLNHPEIKAQIREHQRAILWA